MKHNRLYNLYLTNNIYKEAFVGSWVVQKCAEDVARHYLDRKRRRPAHSMKIEVINTETMQVISEYEMTRQEVA